MKVTTNNNCLSTTIYFFKNYISTNNLQSLWLDTGHGWAQLKS